MSLTPTASDIEYMEAHVKDTEIRGMIAVSMFGICIVVVAVALRFMSRRVVRAEIKADDWIIVLAAGLFISFATSICVAIHFGAGRHAILVEDPKALTEIVILATCLYICTCTATKMSILFLYYRIFPLRRFRIILIVVGSSVIAWTIAIVLVEIFQCWPIKLQWDPTALGHCVNFVAYAITVFTTNVITDLLIFALPLPLVWRLHTSKKRKWMLTATFAIGCGYVTPLTAIMARDIALVEEVGRLIKYSACTISIIRLRFVKEFAKNYDSSCLSTDTASKHFRKALLEGQTPLTNVYLPVTDGNMIMFGKSKYKLLS
ncbi:MAG: hypothetical protein Q9170_008272 [Blastenia crenularia]